MQSKRDGATLIFSRAAPLYGLFQGASPMEEYVMEREISVVKR